MDEEKPRPAPFELFELEWQRRKYVSAREWLDAGEPLPVWQQLERILALYDDPPREAFLDGCPVEHLSDRLAELWLAARLPPAEKNG
jgi:hypothetical protein